MAGWRTPSLTILKFWVLAESEEAPRTSEVIARRILESYIVSLGLCRVSRDLGSTPSEKRGARRSERCQREAMDVANGVVLVTAVVPGRQRKLPPSEGEAGQKRPLLASTREWPSGTWRGDHYKGVCISG